MTAATFLIFALGAALPITYMLIVHFCFLADEDQGNDTRAARH
jgi:hypothetical protein